MTAATTEEMLTTGDKSNGDGLVLNGAISGAHSSHEEVKDQSSDQEGSVNGTFPIDPGPDLHDSSQTTEEMDRENPFFLVKNRKSGHKVTKRH